MDMYVVKMVREKEEYIAGVYSSLEQAITSGEIEEGWDPKYRYNISKHELDRCDNWQTKLAHSYEQGMQLTLFK